MFLGHFALGFAAKRASPRMSLGTAFLAAQFLDLLGPRYCSRDSSRSQSSLAIQP